MFKTQINLLLVGVILLNGVFVVGCHRSYYRRQADAEAKRLIREKSLDPRWDSSDGTIDIDPQSRMFNPFSEDHPPIPPDDPTSHQLMRRVDGKEGYPHWHANGDTDYVEAPEWRQYLPINEKGQVVLTLDGAYQLALLHSPFLQQQREQLYLSALAVSLERFGFDSQLFAGFNNFFTTQGRLRTGTSSSTFQSQLGSNGQGINLNRLGITGANFAVGLANTILFNFSGPNTQAANSIIDFSVIQPLLRGAGRDRILESLTQTERTLLANIRQLERFRRGFYLQVAIGRNPGTGVNGNFLASPGTAGRGVGGFLGLLETQQRIRNQEFNVRQLEGVLQQFVEFFKVDRLDAVQLKLFETNVYREQRSLLELKTNYQTQLDLFVQSLGLPPDLNVIIDDTFLDRFELISDQINDRLIFISKLRQETGEVLNRIDEGFIALENDPKFNWENFQWPDDLGDRVAGLRDYITSALDTIDKITVDDQALIEKDFEKLDATRSERLDYLSKVLRDVKSGKIISSVSTDLFAPDSIQTAENLRLLMRNPEIDEDDQIRSKSILKRAELLKLELMKVLERIEIFPNNLAQMSRIPVPGELDPELYKYLVTEFQEAIPGMLSELNNLALEMSLLQAEARSNSIEIQNVELESEHAIRIARCMRRDLMNARATLVDQWRNIEFVADQLEAQVDLVFEGDIQNDGNNPFKLRLNNGQLRGGFRFDSPIVRLAERNTYRGALIAYQQARRCFYQFEDEIKRNLREILRNIDLNKVLFELDRRTVQVQIQNVEINRYELERPVASTNNSSAGLGNQTARNLVDSIIGLNGAQNAFLRSWVQYEALRRSLDFDLGTMQLDTMGQWLDPGDIDGAIGLRAADMMGVDLDCFCEDIATSYSSAESLQQTMEEYSKTIESIDPTDPNRDRDVTPDPSRSVIPPENDLPPTEQSVPSEESKLTPSDLDDQSFTPGQFRLIEPIQVSPEDFSYRPSYLPPVKPSNPKVVTEDRWQLTNVEGRLKSTSFDGREELGKVIAASAMISDEVLDAGILANQDSRGRTQDAVSSKIRQDLEEAKQLVEEDLKSLTQLKRQMETESQSRSETLAKPSQSASSRKGAQTSPEKTAVRGSQAMDSTDKPDGAESGAKAEWTEDTRSFGGLLNRFKLNQ
ncbi:MAG: hypothetical protein AAF623_00420 [Planctomycetota bacterium]